MKGHDHRSSVQKYWDVMVPGQVLSARNCHSLVAVIARTLLPEEPPDKAANRENSPCPSPTVSSDNFMIISMVLTFPCLSSLSVKWE